MRFLVVSAIVLGAFIKVLGQDSLPIGNMQKVVEDTIRNTDSFSINPYVGGKNGEVLKWLPSKSVEYRPENGSLEGIIEKAATLHIREQLTRFPKVPLEGTLSAFYYGRKILIPGEVFHGLFSQKVQLTPVKTEKGWHIPDEQFKVNIAAGIVGQTHPFFVPNVARVRATYPEGEALIVLDSQDSNEIYRVGLDLEFGIMYLDTTTLEGKPGTIEIWKRDGSWSIFDNADGSLIEHTPSPYRKARVIAVRDTTVELEVETRESDAGKRIQLEVSTDLKAWTLLPYGGPALARLASAGRHVVAKQNSHGFYRALVESAAQAESVRR